MAYPELTTSTTTTFAPGPGIDTYLWTTDSGGSTSYLLQDLLGSVTGRVRAGQSALTERWQYSAYGEVLYGDFDAQPYGYTGREQEGAGWPMYYRARYYRPELGAFTQEDPLAGALAESGNARGREFGGGYSYVGNSPTFFVDPLGLQSEPKKGCHGDTGNMGDDFVLPDDPSGLDLDWDFDPTHKAPNGERWKNKKTKDVLDFHRPGKHQDKRGDHWHHNGGKKHLKPGDQVRLKPRMSNSSINGRNVAYIGLGATGLYATYRLIRLTPSLAPPLWWTIPANVAIP